MEIQSTENRHALIISLFGSLDALTADEAGRSIGVQVNGDQQPIILDLSAVAFMSSSGVRVLLGLLKTCRSLGGDLCLAAPQNGVQRTLEIAGLQRLLKVYPTVEEALRGVTP